MTTIDGACHYGNVEFALHTKQLLGAIVARACECSFYRLHQTKNWSDPLARAELAIRNRDKSNRYRFGLKQVDFYICTDCRVYAGAVLEDAEAA